MHGPAIMKMHHSVSQLAKLAALLLVAGLSACGTTGGAGGASSAAERRAIELAVTGQHAEAAGNYIGLATGAEAEDRDRLVLLAAEQWLLAADTSRARNAMRSLAQPLPAELDVIRQVNEARLLLADGLVDQALLNLENLGNAPLSMGNRLRVDAARAEAWVYKEDPVRAIDIMTQRETWLDDGRRILADRARLWELLKQTHPMVLRESINLAGDPVSKGWLALASLARTTGEQGVGWSNGYLRWREQFPRHPANRLFPDFDDAADVMLDYPRHIAVLLPLSGRTANAGLAIQNGLMGAYLAAAGGLDDRQSVAFYDVSGAGGAIAAYESAVADGAEFVVGPLLRSSVAELAEGTLLPVPVLALNYLPEETPAPPGMFQFALAPEDEAITAAERAIADGHERAVVLTPNSNWGRRVLGAFAQHFESLGGTVLDYRQYTTGNPDYSDTIEDLMALSGSVRRYNRLRANIGGPLQFDPRRREDAELIFLGADADNARLLKSQLKFHYSGDLPVFATSSVNGIDSRSNADLEGVQFAEVPWLVAPQGWIEYLPDLFNEYWPEQRRLARLHAMGYDAYQLIAPLFAGSGQLRDAIDGATGRLRLAADGRVHRILAWAEFDAGQPVPRPLPPGDELPSLDLPDEGNSEANWLSQ